MRGLWWVEPVPRCRGHWGAGHRARALAGLQGSKEIPLRALHPARGTWDAGDRAHSPETACPAACSAVVEMLPVGTARHGTIRGAPASVAAEHGHVPLPGCSPTDRADVTSLPWTL